MTSCVEKHYLQRTDQFLPKMSCKTDTYLEETLKDIDEFIQAELGFAPLSSIEPSTAVELHDLSSFLQTRETFNGSVVGHTLGNPAASYCFSHEKLNQVLEVDVEVQIMDLKDVYDKKTKKTNEGLEYRLENSEVTVAVRASDEITSVQAYTQRCAEAAIRTHDTSGPVELDVNTLQSDSRYRAVTVDLGSVYKTREGDSVYWLEKAEVMKRNKWELIIAMEFSSCLKGTVKSRPFRVTTKASYKMRRNGDSPSSNKVQQLFRKFTWSDNQDLTDLSGRNKFLQNRGIKQEYPGHESTDNSGFGRSSAEGKILFQLHTVLDRHMVTTYYCQNPKIRYVVEQPELPGLLKLVGKPSMLGSAHSKANRHKSSEEGFWWACGRCFFERRKKSTIKAHVIQRVCQKPIEIRTSRRKLTSRHLSQCTAW